MSLVGQRIQELREEKGLTQLQLSKGIVSRSYLSQIEKGNVHPSYSLLKKIASKLECKIEELLEEPKNNSFKISMFKKYLKELETNIEAGKISESIKTYKKLNLELKSNLSNYEKGILYWAEGKLAENNNSSDSSPAIEKYRESIKLLKKTNYINEWIRSINDLASLYLKLQKNNEAFQWLDTAYDALIKNQIGGVLKTSLLINLGHAHINFGEYHSAIRYLKEAENLNKSSDVHVKSGKVYLLLALCYKELDDYECSKEYNKKALKFFELTEEHESIANIYNNMGNLFLKQGLYDMAIDYFEKAVKLYKEIQHIQGFLLSKTGMAKSHYHNGHFKLSEEICNEIISQNHEKQYKGIAFIILGDIRFNEKKYQAALENYNNSFALFNENNIQWGERYALKKIALLHFNQREYEKAAKIFIEIDRKTEIINFPLFI